MMRGLLLIVSLFLSPMVLAVSFDIPQNGDSVVGQTYYVTTKHIDTLVDVAQRNNVGYDEIKRANPGVDPWLPGEGTRILIPSQFVLPGAVREGVVINLAEKRIFYYPPPREGHGSKVFTYPISIGRQDWQTPLGITKVVRMKKDPTWTPPESIKKEHEEKGDPLPDVVPAGPNNPLGNRAIYLGIPGYLIHGTNKPSGIGMRVSHGCIRMLPATIEEFFDLLPVGSRVELIDQPFKFGIMAGELFLEAHEPANTDVNLHNSREELERILVEATGGSHDYFAEWDAIEQEINKPSGVPLAVGFFNRPAFPVEQPIAEPLEQKSPAKLKNKKQKAEQVKEAAEVF